MDLFGVRKNVTWEAKPDYLMRMRDVAVTSARESSAWPSSS
jgi:hypothetical protein